MRADLDQLLIKDKEFFEITGIGLEDVRGIANRVAQAKVPAKRSYFFLLDLLYVPFAIALMFLLFFPLIWGGPALVGLLIPGLSLSVTTALTVTALISGPLGVAVGFSVIHDNRQQRRSLKRLILLLEDLEQYNQLIHALHIKEQLAVIQADETPTSEQERERLLANLAQVRADILKALKIERVFRENSQYVNLDALDLESGFIAERAEQLGQEFEEYQTVLNQSLAIGMSVRTEIQDLQADLQQRDRAS